MFLRILEMTKIKYKVCKLSHLQKYPKLVNLNQFNRMSRYKDKEAGLSKDSGAKIMIQMKRKMHVNLLLKATSIQDMKVFTELRDMILIRMNQKTSVLFV